MKQVKKLLKEMIFGIGLWAAVIGMVLMLTAVWIHENPLAMAAGVAVGSLTAVGLLFHMYKHLDIALELAPDRAGKHVQFAAIKRMFVMAVVMAAAFRFMDFLHPAGVAFGILGLKVSALMYPGLHSFFQKHGIYPVFQRKSGAADDKA